MIRKVWEPKVVNNRFKYLSKVKKVVVKIGSSLVTNQVERKIRTPFLNHLATQIQIFQKKGIECLIVTSGAIAAGLFKLELEKRPKKISQLQALAAIGQCNLMHAYEVAFNRCDLKVAQVLLTRRTFPIGIDIPMPIIL